MHDVRSLVDVLFSVYGVVRLEPVFSNLQPQIDLLFIFDWFVGLLDIDFLKRPGCSLVVLPGTQNFSK